MKLADMREGKFRLSYSPNPDIKICDWPISQQNFTWLYEQAQYQRTANKMMPDMLYGLMACAVRMKKALDATHGFILWDEDDVHRAKLRDTLSTLK